MDGRGEAEQLAAKEAVHEAAATAERGPSLLLDEEDLALLAERHQVRLAPGKAGAAGSDACGLGAPLICHVFASHGPAGRGIDVVASCGAAWRRAAPHLQPSGGYQGHTGAQGIPAGDIATRCPP